MFDSADPRMMAGEAKHGLEVRGLSVRSQASGKALITDVFLDAKHGEVLWIVGPSGAGKTTLLRAIAGIEHIHGGSIVVDGRVLANRSIEVPPEQRRVGMVFQNAALFPHLSAADNVAFGLNGRARPARATRAQEMLERVELADVAERLPHTLSGGEAQRVALARALATDPDVMLLDEPFAGLDPQLRTDLAAAVCRVLRDSGTVAVLVGHNPEDAMRFADRISVMHDGRVLQLGTPEEIYSHPNDAFCAGILGHVNRIPVKVQGGQVATPFGPVGAPGFSEGSAAELLVREEGLLLGNGTPVMVRSVRSLGALAVVAIQPRDDSRILHARVPADSAPAEGTEVLVRLDPARAFVFPMDG
ncbi:MAG: ABC transporter ATP-binding protein [Rhodospirillales bacterium]|nr:ABC transporter ATP-binding protein [Rhodospirillales bacterium]